MQSSFTITPHSQNSSSKIYLNKPTIRDNRGKDNKLIKQWLLWDTIHTVIQIDAKVNISKWLLWNAIWCTVIKVDERASTRLEAFAMLAKDIPMINDERLATQRTMRGQYRNLQPYCSCGVYVTGSANLSENNILQMITKKN